MAETLEQLIDRLRAVEAEIEAAFAARDAERAAAAGLVIEAGKPCLRPTPSGARRRIARACAWPAPRGPPC